MKWDLLLLTKVKHPSSFWPAKIIPSLGLILSLPPVPCLLVSISRWPIFSEYEVFDFLSCFLSHHLNCNYLFLTYEKSQKIKIFFSKRFLDREGTKRILSLYLWWISSSLFCGETFPCETWVCHICSGVHQLLVQHIRVMSLISITAVEFLKSQSFLGHPSVPRLQDRLKKAVMVKLNYIFLGFCATKTFTLCV